MQLSVAGEAAAIDAKGRTVVAGTVIAGGRTAFELARYMPEGSLDKTFGSGGKVVGGLLDPSVLRRASAVAVDPRGRIVVAGGDPYFLLARYKPNGDLDRSFGTRGRVRTSFGEDEVAASALVIDTAGRIVVAGSDCPGGLPGCTRSFAVARYNADGHLDRKFGDGGKRLLSVGSCQAGIGSGAGDVAIDPSGRVVLAGGATTCGGQAFGLARLTPSGALDPTFGSGGVATTSFNGAVSAGAAGVAIDPAGRIVAGGLANYPTGTVGLANTQFVFARYNPDGSLDSTFGSGGQVRTAFGQHAAINAVAINSAGRIVAAGSTDTPSGYFDHDFALARYTPNGALDPTFASGGQVTTPFGSTAVANALAIDSAGRAVAVGTAGTSAFESYGSGFALARYTPLGELDPTFGSGGQVTTMSFPPNAAISRAKVNSKARTATFRFRATGPSRDLRCALRSGGAQPTFQVCTSPKTYRRLRPGHYTFAVKGFRAGARDRNPATRRFTLFARPNTKITKTKINSVRGVAKFAFTGTGKTTRLACKLTRRHSHRRARFDRCRSPTTYKHLRPDRYTFAVRAVGPGGRDETPAKRKFGIG